MQAKLRVSAPRRSQLIGSTLAAHACAILPLLTTSEGAILGSTAAECGERRLRSDGCDTLPGVWDFTENAGARLGSEPCSTDRSR
jgi:hypothetical protein